MHSATIGSIDAASSPSIPVLPCSDPQFILRREGAIWSLQRPGELKCFGELVSLLQDYVSAELSEEIRSAFDAGKEAGFDEGYSTGFAEGQMEGADA